MVPSEPSAGGLQDSILCYRKCQSFHGKYFVVSLKWKIRVAKKEISWTIFWNKVGKETEKEGKI